MMLVTYFGSLNEMKEKLHITDNDIVFQDNIVSMAAGQHWPNITNTATVKLPNKVIGVYNPMTDPYGWRTVDIL